MSASPNPEDSPISREKSANIRIDNEQKGVSHGAGSLAVDESQLPKGYFYSSRFLGTFFAVSINLMANTGGFAYIAPVIPYINQDIGPGQVTWLSVVYTMMLAVSLTLVGQLSDIFGRRYFFIGGTFMCLIGSIICSQARTIPVLIGGEALIGLGACTGMSYAFILGELVPMKHRFLINAFAYILVFPSAGFGAVVSTSFILYTNVGWRGCYYLLIGANGTACLLYTLFYFPPNFKQKHGSDAIMTWVRNYDYVGMFLYVSGLLLFILGLQWGGTVYPWKSAAVIACILIGFCLLVALVLYEGFFDVREPLVPLHFFRRGEWVAAVITLALGASTYYAMALVWPQMATLVYSNGDLLWAGWVGCLPGVGCNLGEVLGSIGAGKIRKTKWQSVFFMAVGTALLGAMASCTPDTPGRGIALMFLGVTAVGYVEAIASPMVNIVIDNQDEIGTASGIAGSIRSSISTIAQTIYTVVLTSRTTETISGRVPTALVAAGLPPASVETYMTTVAAGGDATMLSEIAGVTVEVMTKGARAYQEAYTDAFRTLFYVSIAFGGLAVITSILSPNVEGLMTGSVTATLNKGMLQGDSSEDEERTEA